MVAPNGRDLAAVVRLFDTDVFMVTPLGGRLEPSRRQGKHDHLRDEQHGRHREAERQRAREPPRVPRAHREDHEAHDAAGIRHDPGCARSSRREG